MRIPRRQGRGRRLAKTGPHGNARDETARSVTGPCGEGVGRRCVRQTGRAGPQRGCSELCLKRGPRTATSRQLTYRFTLSDETSGHECTSTIPTDADLHACQLWGARALLLQMFPASPIPAALTLHASCARDRGSRSQESRGARGRRLGTHFSFLLSRIDHRTTHNSHQRTTRRQRARLPNSDHLISFRSTREALWCRRKRTQVDNGSSKRASGSSPLCWRPLDARRWTPTRRAKR